MFDRSTLKQAAKDAFRRNGYWAPFFVSLLTAIFAGGSFTSSRNSLSGGESDPIPSLYEDFARGISDPNFVYPWVISSLLVIMALGIFYSFFIQGPLLVGRSRFYLEHRHERIRVGRIFYAFKNGYIHVAIVMFIRSLKIFLWSLLLIVPGIIKSYQYYFVDYLLAENPSLSSERAMQISRDMTNGFKFDIFVFELSFFGWALLCILTLGIGAFFLEPYVMASTAELYAFLRQRALEYGYTSPEELPGFVYEPENAPAQ